MEGVTILNTCNSTYKCMAISMLVCGCVLLAVFFCCLILYAKKVGVHFLLSTLLLGLVLFCTGLHTLIFQKELHTEYEVIVDESVSLQEFHDTYEIIEKRGQIWTVREIHKD